MSRRNASAVLMSVLLPAVAVGVWFATRPAPPREPAVAPPRPDAERDLKLEFEPYQTDVVSGRELGVRKLELVNMSETTTYRVVKPGDGSADGRREPYVYFTAEARLDDGRWVNVEREPWSVCGNFNGNWQKDVVELKPGESLPLSWARPHFSFQRPGVARITAHYEYLSRPWEKATTPDADRGAMGDCPAFHLTSAPVVLTVSRPWDVTVKVVGTAMKGVPVDVATVVTVALANRSGKPFTVGGVGEGGSRLSVLFTPLVDNRKQEAGVSIGWRGMNDLDSKNGPPPPAKLTVSAGESAVLLGETVRPAGNTTWTPRKAGRHRVTVEYWPVADSRAVKLTAETELVVGP